MNQVDIENFVNEHPVCKWCKATPKVVVIDKDSFCGIVYNCRSGFLADDMLYQNHCGFAQRIRDHVMVTFYIVVIWSARSLIKLTTALITKMERWYKRHLY